MIAGAAWCLGLVAPPVAAQQPDAPGLEVAEDTTLLQEVRLKDGTTLVGRVIRIADGAVTVRTTGGLEVTMRVEDVARVAVVRGVVREGELWMEDPSDSRLFVGPTGRVIPHGHGYAGVYELLVASLGVGVGDLAMVSGGMSLVPGIDLAEQVFYIAPKVRLFAAPGLQAAGGMFWVKPGSSEESAGMVFGTLTAGDPIAAATVALGVPFASEGGFAEDPLVMLGGELRVDRRFKLITENWIVPGAGGALLSFGFRMIARGLTVEAGAVTSTEGGGFLPIVNFSIAW